MMRGRAEAFVGGSGGHNYWQKRALPAEAKKCLCQDDQLPMQNLYNVLDVEI